MDLINSKGVISKSCIEIFFDKTITRTHKTLEGYLLTLENPYNKKHIHQIQTHLETQVFNAAEYISHIIYYIQKLSENWGAAGEQQVKNSFLKNIFQLQASDTITYEQYDKFEEKINLNFERLGITNMPLETAKSHIKNYKFKFLDRLFKITDTDPINQLLQFAGSHKYYFSGAAGELLYYLFGTAKITHIKEYTIVTYTHEDIHSPNVIQALAALTGKQIIIVRNYSLECIFHQKWIPAIESKGHSYYQNNPFWTISQSIKEKCLSLYKTHTAEELLVEKKAFLKDMKETIAHHELGHTIIDHRYLTPEELGLGQATENIKETIFASMLEFFADFAPKCDGFLGPIQNMCKIAKHDIPRAERMFYMYLSDVWFYDTPDTYMYLYSDLMILVLLKYIRKDQHINFDALEQDTHIRKSRPDKDGLTILERLYELYIQDTKEIITIAKNAAYQLDKKINYERVSTLMKNLIKEDFPLVPVASETYGILYWKGVINFILKVSDSGQRLINYIDEQEKLILKKVLILTSGRKKAEAYNYDHRKFICDRMLELGFTSK